MNHFAVAKTVGYLALVEAGCLAVPMLVALGFADGSFKAFALSVFICVVLGAALSRINADMSSIRIKEGMAIVAVGWAVFSLLGSLPFMISGAIPSFTDAFFETVSGFTTAGSSILSDVEALPEAVLFWRSFTHWIGGIGILFFVIALGSPNGVGFLYVMRAESPGPAYSKTVPTLRQSVITVGAIYVALSAAETVLLLLGGMNLYDAVVNTFATMGTGGFAVKNASIRYYDSAYTDVVITVFMVIAGANFSLYYLALRGNIKEALRDEELRLYAAVFAACSLFIAADLAINNVYSSLPEALRYSSFQTASIMTTTGFATANYDLWPQASKAALFVLFFVGGCAGSTAGSIKVVRHLINFKAIRRDIVKMLYPKTFAQIRISGAACDDGEVLRARGFMSLYGLFLFAGAIFICIADKTDLTTAFTACMATLGNVGPGFALVGPAENFGFFCSASKWMMSFLMIAGRLEIYTVIVLFFPRFWKR